MLEQGKCWTENIPKPNEAVFNVLIAICIQRDANWYEALGTGFVVGVGDGFATAISAAHVFDHIYHRQNPLAVERHTVLDILHPLPQEVDLDPEKVFGFIFQAGRTHRLKFSDLFYERRSDFAMFKVTKTRADSRRIFTHNIRMDAELPIVGTVIEGIGFKHMSFSPHMDGASLKVRFEGCLTRRIGKVSEVHPDGNLRLRTPCVTATFPIFGGMSGGPVLRVATGLAPAAFGILSSDFEEDIETKYDQSQFGTTNVAKLPLKWTADEQGDREATFTYVSDEIGSGA
jgi:hypothetical protein